MERELNIITLSSLKRIQRLMRKGYEIDVEFYAHVKGHGKYEYKIHMCYEGELFVHRCLLETYDYDSDTYKEEELYDVSLDDLTPIVGDGNIFYHSERA